MPDDALLSFLPRIAVEWVTASPAERHRALPGSMVFVDVSGFTKLSERLAHHGKIGAEELAATIGGCFVELLAVAYDLGGGLIKFGGDALLLVLLGPWARGPGGRRRRRHAQRATAHRPA